MKKNGINDTVYELVLAKNNTFLVQLLRYAVVGGIATVADIGTLFLLTELAGMHYLLSAVLGFVMGIMVNYILSVLWVFTSSKKMSKFAEVLLFVLIGIVGLALNEAIMYVVVEWIGVLYLIAKLISTAIVLCWNFLARKYFVF